MNANLPGLLRSAQAALAAGRPEDAVRLSQEAVAVAPDDPTAHVVRGIALAAQGDVPTAEEALRRALELAPDHLEATIALTRVLVSTGRVESGLDMASSLVERHPHDPDLWMHFGLLLAETGRYQEAVLCFERVVALDPGSVPGHQNLAAALRDSGREFDSATVWERVVRMAPRSLDAWINLGRMRLAHGRFDEAIVAADHALALQSYNSNAHLLKALALSEDGRGNEAERHLVRAVRYDAENAVAHASLGFWFQEQGRFSEAREALLRSIELNPRHGFAYYNLFRAKKADDGDAPMLGRLRDLAADPTIPMRDRGYMHYALAKAAEDRGDFETAMRGYDEGNRCAHEVWLSRKPWDRDAYAAGFEQTRQTFTADHMRSLSRGANESVLPILIVGMIRSGTSLLEQMLSSHPEVAGAGELPFWHKNEERIGEQDALAELAGEYLSELDRFAPTAKRVTDKLPHNYAMLGAIHSALPNARIVHVRRNPADNCLSVYTTAYQRPPVFAHDRENIVFAYREYLALMDHWRQAIPADRLLEVTYEELVADREGWLRRIVDFCGLEWDDACLRHEANARAVRTPSLWQVRQPIYTTSVERWRRFEPWIPEFAALGSETSIPTHR